ncbi:MAG: glycoside hydrolase [Alphaproteobacteria bacterium]|uniref:Glycoside hydrolase n=1 Tax=Candidatus Nitrobium versatile TaxID=2884831 RepID=A0A953SHY5_9BACT|nr:glycoside hydrolase [Candidatus Nitrobium versatile]
MTDSPLHIAFLWHMHQPYYKDPFTGVYRLPWVRLHGIKDYLDMLKILEEFPPIHQTFNLVPSLLEQLTDYLENGATDRYLDLTLKHPSALTEHEKMFIIENFFLANWDNMIKPLPRYYELLVKRGFRFTRGDLIRVSRYFSESDIMDLQVLFNLTWIDPLFRNSDPFLRELMEKQRDFTEEEKRLLIEKQFAILKQIIPAYKRMGQSGQIELSVTPFYHPILPLLWDTDTARIAMPQVRLPRRRFSHPEDAVRQIRMGLDYFEKLFGYRPSGMWPSEGSVSEDVVRAAGREGIRWMASDEEVLSRSMGRAFRSPEGHLIDAPALYRPHQFDGVSLFFRDHKLSDLIGFTYSGWNAQRAVDDFMGKLVQIRNTLPRDRTYVVPVILDGENAWEYYSNDGQDFLRCLYAALSCDSRFRTVTLSEFLREQGPGDGLSRLHPGSWINANFGVWLGHEEDNLAWDYLAQTREDLEAFAAAHPDRDLTEAWNAVFAAEGSDWNWWYGDEHTTETQADFDELFRSHLMKVYKAMGKEIPPHLYVPILLEDRSFAPTVLVRGFIHPRIDGMVTSYFEWHQAAFIDVKRSGGSMHKSESFISTLHYGFNKDNLYLRIDAVTPFSEIRERIIVHINIVRPHPFRIIFDVLGKEQKALLYEKALDSWDAVKQLGNVAAGDIFEIEIPFADIRAEENDELDFSLEVMRNGEEVERCPWRGHITVTVPTPYYETLMWY